MTKVLQWNIKGYWNNYHELQLLLNEYNPAIIALQETHLHYGNSPTPPKSFCGYYHNLPINTSNKQGICVLIKQDIPQAKLDVTSNISTIAIEINIGFKLTIISMYIPPDQNFNSSELLSVLTSISTPILLLGDFNSWSPLWGSDTVNQRGKSIEDVLLASNLIVLNDGSSTHFSTHKTFTNIDISLCSPNLAAKCSWKILNNPYGSDHFPIIITIESNHNNDRIRKPPRFITDKANWSKFQKTCDDLCLKTPTSDNIHKEAANIKKILRAASHLHIPQTKNRLLKPSVPWWNNELANLRHNKQNAWAKYKKQQNEYNLIAYKKANATFRYNAKLAKRKCFANLTDSINPSTNPKDVWHSIRLISGSHKQNKVSVINTERGTITESKEIANHFSSVWSAFSSDTNFDQEFISKKTRPLVDLIISPILFPKKLFS